MINCEESEWNKSQEGSLMLERVLDSVRMHESADSKSGRVKPRFKHQTSAAGINL